MGPGRREEGNLWGVETYSVYGVCAYLYVCPAVCGCMSNIWMYACGDHISGVFLIYWGGVSCSTQSLLFQLLWLAISVPQSPVSAFRVLGLQEGLTSIHHLHGCWWFILHSSSLHSEHSNHWTPELSWESSSHMYFNFSETLPWSPVLLAILADWGGGMFRLFLYYCMLTGSIDTVV